MKKHATVNPTARPTGGWVHEADQKIIFHHLPDSGNLAPMQSAHKQHDSVHQRRRFLCLSGVHAPAGTSTLVETNAMILKRTSVRLIIFPGLVGKINLYGSHEGRYPTANPLHKQAVGVVTSPMKRTVKPWPEYPIHAHCEDCHSGSEQNA